MAMRMMRVTICVVVAIAAGAEARGASFDCKLAKSPQEKVICATPALSRADEQMAAVYKRQLAVFPAAYAEEFRAQQRVWLKQLRTGCDAENKMTDCLASQYKARIDVLEGAVVRKGGVVFVTRSVQLLSPDEAEEKKNENLQSQEENPGFGTLNASWPEAIAPKEVLGSGEWKAWNAAVLEATQAMALESDKPLGGTEWKKEWAAGTETDLSATVLSVGQGRVAVHIENDFMGHGAAHPGEVGENLNWILGERRELKAGDVFKEGTAWKSFLARRCHAELLKQFAPENPFYDKEAESKAMLETVASPRNWALTPQGLAISFPEYDVMPRLYHPDDVTVPWSVLRPFLASGFAVPQ